MQAALILIAIAFSTLFTFPADSHEYAVQDDDRLRIGIVGLTHTHVHWILGREDKGDIEIVGIAEPNRDLAERYCRQHGIDFSLIYPTMESMVEATSPEAVTAFNDTYHHLDLVRYCAPEGIHVMVEKPLAVSMEHAREMAILARKHNIHLLTNYETTWYSSNKKAYDMIHSGGIGDIRKIVFYTGHQGPIEIGCNAEFLDWLTDPLLNGGGALTDFGCYGANLATWVLKGEQPVSISCDTQHIKSEIYPDVEDEATIIIKYSKSQVVIMASWNWPFNRKEMEVYGTGGSVICKDETHMIISSGDMVNAPYSALPLTSEPEDPFAYLHAVIKDNHPLEPWSPSSLENNLRVMEILDAAKKASAD